MIYVVIGCALFLLVFGYWKGKQSSERKFAKKAQELTAQTEQALNEVAVKNQQIRHHKTRKKNEEKAHHSGRDTVIDRLQQSGDLRD